MVSDKIHLIDGVVHKNYFNVNGSSPVNHLLELSPAQLHALANDGSGIEISFNEKDNAVRIAKWRDTYDTFEVYDIHLGKFLLTILGSEAVTKSLEAIRQHIEENVNAGE